MTDEAIDIELARTIEHAFPRTVADALTYVFSVDATFRGTIDGQRGVSDTDVTHLHFTIKLSTPTAVALAHLRRLQEIESRGEPNEHDLFKKP